MEQSLIMPALTSWMPQPTAEPRLRALLARVSAAPQLHARFLNTLSLLEHIGSRKIMATQSGAPGGETLQHLAEEARHAFFFKRQAEAAAGHPLAYGAGEIMAGPQARAYMARLDAFIARGAKGMAAYLYMSLVVELRAIWFYRIYQDVLAAAGRPIRLTGLLAEETRHLQEMGERLAALGEDVEARLPSFTAYEETRFSHLLCGLERAAA